MFTVIKILKIEIHKYEILIFQLVFSYNFYSIYLQLGFTTRLSIGWTIHQKIMGDLKLQKHYSISIS